MRRLFFIIQKEFIQIFRNKAMLPIISVVPILQLVLLSYAADNEVKNVQLAIVNHDQSAYARQLIEKIRISDRFILVDTPSAAKIADKEMQEGAVDIILTIPPQFEKKFLKYKSGDIQLLINAINGSQATVGAAYLSAIIQAFGKEIREDAAPHLIAQQQNPYPNIQIASSNWFNPTLNYKHFMVPGLIGELVIVLIMMLTAM